jgi:hypothetical protein
MSSTAMPLPKPPTNGAARERRVGTFADGQRAAPVTVAYSAKVGSFGGPAQS